MDELTASERLRIEQQWKIARRQARETGHEPFYHFTYNLYLTPDEGRRYMRTFGLSNDLRDPD